MAFSIDGYTGLEGRNPPRGSGCPAKGVTTKAAAQRSGGRAKATAAKTTSNAKSRAKRAC
jgi:hypothetical protein